MAYEVTWVTSYGRIQDGGGTAWFEQKGGQEQRIL